MGKNNYDDLADLFGPKGFHDFVGDGHIDDLEASFMLAVIADEIEEFERENPQYTETGAQSQGCGCLGTVIFAIIAAAIWQVLAAIFD